MKALGYLAIVVSNQRGVARGIMTERDVDAIHDSMQDALEMNAVRRSTAFISARTTTLTVSDCRKPKPGMLVVAAEDWKIDCAESWLIGDSESDIQAGKLRVAGRFS